MANLVEKLGEYAPKRFFAGEFPVVRDTGTAGEAIAQYDLVMTDASGELMKAKATEEGGIENLAGIAVNDAAEGEPVVFIMTGEVFADAVGLDATITVDAAKAALRKLSIFLK